MTSGNRGSMPAGDAAASTAEPSTNGFYVGPRIGSLCSGYGGLDLGLMAVVGGSVAWHVEYDKHPSAVLDARFPGVPNYGDVTATDWTQVEPVDWLTAGYPCQPFSHAGKRKGSADERHLWPAVADAIGVLRPGRVLLENVAGHVSLGLDAVLADLAALGYDATWGVVRAADAGACHSRARVFIVAGDTEMCGRDAAQPSQRRGEPTGATGGSGVAPSDSTERRRRGSEGQQRGLGTSERLATAAADADEQGRQGAEPAGRRLVSARCAPADAEGLRRGTGPRPRSAATGYSEPRAVDDLGVRWGAYEPAIRRWERILGRTAPRPTERGRTGERLNPRFVEWMQGLPDGHVTDILGRGPALKCLGNGVVPQQAALAITVLMQRAEVAA